MKVGLPANGTFSEEVIVGSPDPDPKVTFGGSSGTFAIAPEAFSGPSCSIAPSMWPAGPPMQSLVFRALAIPIASRFSVRASPADLPTGTPITWVIKSFTLTFGDTSGMSLGFEFALPGIGAPAGGSAAPPADRPDPSIDPLVVIYMFLYMFMLFYAFAFYGSEFSARAIPTLAPVLFAFASFMAIPGGPVPVCLRPSVSSI